MSLAKIKNIYLVLIFLFRDTEIRTRASYPDLCLASNGFSAIRRDC